MTREALLDAAHAEIHGAAAPEIAGLDRVARVQSANFEAGTAALCFSGGGVRSAAFCLGVAQGLAARGMLKRFQYLSTGSGGGYAGGMLTAWMYRAAHGAAYVGDIDKVRSMLFFVALLCALGLFVLAGMAHA